MIPLEIYIITALIAGAIPTYFWRKECQRAKYYKAGKSYWKQCAKQNEYLIEAWRNWGNDFNRERNRLMDVLRFIAKNFRVQGNSKRTGKYMYLTNQEILKGDFSRTSAKQNFGLNIFSETKKHSQ